GRPGRRPGATARRPPGGAAAGLLVPRRRPRLRVRALRAGTVADQRAPRLSSRPPRLHRPHDRPSHPLDPGRRPQRPAPRLGTVLLATAREAGADAAAAGAAA